MHVAVRAAVAASPVPQALKPGESSAFYELRSAGRVQMAEGVCACAKHGLGLFSKIPQGKGQVLIQVPRGLAITVDFKTGLTMPDGPWPRLREGVEAAEPLTWDLLQSMALLDGLAGDATGFWRGYCEAMLPDPDRLAQPLCLSKERLAALHHKELADGGLEQQARLTKLFPDLMEPVDTDLPSWLQWAFACARSRAVKVGEEAFAVVPFLDLANHADRPNADFRPSADGAFFELVAVGPIAPGSEITVSYSGPQGYTNQRWMAQYGFVPKGGNRADRLAFQPLPSTAAPLSLLKLEEVVGSQLFASTVQGSSNYLYAALKSLPVVDQEEAEGPAAAAASRATAQLLLDQTLDMIQAAPTSLAEDEAALQALVRVDDRRAHTALQYRVERKRLLEHARVLLAAYAKQ